MTQDDRECLRYTDEHKLRDSNHIAALQHDAKAVNAALRKIAIVEGAANLGPDITINSTFVAANIPAEDEEAHVYRYRRSDSMLAEGVRFNGLSTEISHSVDMFDTV